MAAALNQQRAEMDLRLFLLHAAINASPPHSGSQISSEKLGNPHRHAVSEAWMRQRGPLSVTGPPWLFSPSRYCVSPARACSVPGRREGGSRGGTGEGRTATGGRNGEQSRANVGRAWFLRCLVIKEMSVFFVIWVFWGKLCLARGRLCLLPPNNHLSQRWSPLPPPPIWPMNNSFIPK